MFRKCPSVQEVSVSNMCESVSSTGTTL